MFRFIVAFFGERKDLSYFERYSPTIPMVKIRNKTNQRLSIKLASGQTIILAAGGTADISEADARSPAVQTLISRGQIAIISGTTGTARPR